ncbi:MAG: hypothetical protein Q9217_006546 [Psora testacea]
MQVAPAELEAHILTHPSVADCAVIPIHDDSAGERPKAFVVKSASVGLESNDFILVRQIKKHVENNKARHKWLAEVTFIDMIPKSPSGKILRRLLRDKDREARRQKGAKLEYRCASKGHIYLYMLWKMRAADGFVAAKARLR